MLKSILFLVLLSEICAAANILGIFHFPGFSHFIMFRAFFTELANRGHNVDVVSHFPLKNPPERYQDISIRGSTPLVTNNVSVASLKKLEGVDFIKKLINRKFCEDVFNTPQLRTLRNSTKKYDLVITELCGSDCMLGWAWHFGAPSIVMTTSANMPWAAERFGLPDNPSYIPHYFIGYGARMTFYERLVNTWTLLRAKILFRLYCVGASNRLVKGFFGKDMPDLDILAHNTSLQLVNTHFSLSSGRPLVPNVIEVAGLHIGNPKPVSEHFEKLLTANENGIIYFTMGSVALSESLPPEILQAMFDAFSELPYRVLWKATKEKFPPGLNIPNNINFEKWMPQLDLLCDPRTKLFVSHGGMMGTQEAVYCGIPVLGVPLFADQELNLKHAEASGYAVMVEYEHISKETILTAARKLLNDPTYRENAKRISEEFKDRPLSAMDTAVYWTEYVIRHKGAPKLQSAAKYLTWYQYYLLDVIAVSVGVPFIILFVIIKIFKLVLKNCGIKKNVKLKLR